jgi:XTP/dITP diphosphohydrolase
MTELVLASSNAGKIREIQALLPSYRIRPQADFGIADADETACSFVENALIKARHACLHSGLPAIADDSGLAVDALDGAPGVYSARYAGPQANDAANIDKLLAALDGLPDRQRSAQFICVLVYMRHAHDPMPLIAQGLWKGRILSKPQGAHGFGYDPIFWLEEQQSAAAELPLADKNRLSHRAQALLQLREFL